MISGLRQAIGPLRPGRGILCGNVIHLFDAHSVASCKFVRRDWPVLDQELAFIPHNLTVQLSGGILVNDVDMAGRHYFPANGIVAPYTVVGKAKLPKIF